MLNELKIELSTFTLDFTPEQVILYSLLKSYPDKYWTTNELEQILLWSKQKIWREIGGLVEYGWAEKHKILDKSDKVVTVYKYDDTI